MATWVRFECSGHTSFGRLDGTTIHLYQGDLFGDKTSTGEIVQRDEVTLLTPCTPGKLLALWNNFHATMAKTGLPRPEHPWYFIKTPNTYAPGSTELHRPTNYSGKIVFEGELGVVIGKSCRNITIEAADDVIFGYTCINDVTAVDYLFKEDHFAHWIRAKCCDGFGVIGPGITQGVNPDHLVIRTYLESDDVCQERQNYPVSDMIYGPREIVSRISHDMTLNPGDIIACGTSLGAGAMKDGWNVRIAIDGVGELINRFVDTQ